MIWNKSSRLNLKGNVLSRSINGLVKRLERARDRAKKAISEADVEIKELEMTKKTNQKVVKFVNNLMKGVE